MKIEEKFEFLQYNIEGAGSARCTQPPNNPGLSTRPEEFYSSFDNIKTSTGFVGNVLGPPFSQREQIGVLDAIVDLSSITWRRSFVPLMAHR
jgi:hypothetical protein